MVCIPAPACKALLSEATTRWPMRNRASDGICGDARHQARVSDHNRGQAVDLTHDPKHGVDCDVLAEVVKDDPRVKYVIWNRRIWNPSISRAWRKYTGDNPHDHHMHVSIRAACRDDVSPWFGHIKATSPAPAVVLTEEDDMPMTCTVPWAPRQPNGRVPFLEVIPVKGANEALVVSYNGAPLTPAWDDKRDGDDVLFGYSTRRVTSLTGPATGIDVAPDGRSVVVLCRGGGTYDVARKP